MLKEQGLRVIEKGDFNPIRKSAHYFKNASMEAHFVTSCGDYTVLSTDSNNTSVSIASYSNRKLQGYPVAYYFVVRATTNGVAPNSSSAYMTLTYNMQSTPSVYDNDGLANTLRSVNSDTSQILALLGGGDSPLTDVFSVFFCGLSLSSFLTIPIFKLLYISVFILINVLTG